MKIILIEVHNPHFKMEILRFEVYNLHFEVELYTSKCGFTVFSVRYKLFKLYYWYFKQSSNNQQFVVWIIQLEVYNLHF